MKAFLYVKPEAKEPPEERLGTYLEVDIYKIDLVDSGVGHFYITIRGQNSTKAFMYTSSVFTQKKEAEEYFRQIMEEWDYSTTPVIGGPADPHQPGATFNER